MVSAAGSGKTTLLTCPGGQTVLVKAITVSAANTAAQVVRFDIEVATVDYLLWRRTRPAGADTDLLAVFWVFEPGDKLKVVASATESYTVTVHGALLDGVAPAI